MKIAGVYKITNNITGDFYIGSSKNIENRWANHRSPSVWKLHPNVKLYKAMAQYGRDNFTFEIIEKTDNLKEREQYYIECLKPSYNNYRAQGWDTDRYKEADKRSYKEWYKIHRDERLTYNKAYNQAHRNKYLAKKNSYNNRLCFYEGETLTLGTLSSRFTRQGIPHSTLEAKKYLIEKEH